MANDLESQVDHKSVLHGQDGVLHTHRGKPTIDQSRQLSDSEKKLQREHDAYGDQIFKPDPELQKRVGMLHGKYRKINIERDFGVGRVNRDGKPFFWVRHERPQDINNTGDWVFSICDENGVEIMTISNNGIILECNGFRYDLCNVLEELRLAGSITPLP